MANFNFGPSDVAAMLPGQASQEQGMGVEAAESNDRAKRLFAIGSEIAEIDLLSYCTETPTKEMTGPLVQPALGAAIGAKYIVAREKGLKPSVILGQSVSEIIALWAGGGLNDRDMFSILTVRGQAMDEANRNNPSIMTAFIGASRKQFDWLVAGTQRKMQELNLPSVHPGMYNSRFQQVASGHPLAIERMAKMAHKLTSLKETAKSRFNVDLRRVTIKQVKDDGGSHSEFMAESYEPVFEAIVRAKKSKPTIPVLANNGQYLVDPELYAPYLAGQVKNPADWEGSLWVALDDGVRNFIEVEGGNRQVLTKNMRHDFNAHTVITMPFGEVVRIESVPEDYRPDMTHAA